LLSGDRISEVQFNDIHNANPLSVSIQASGKKRLILDLRIINEHLYKAKFKYEDHRKALDYFVNGGYASKFDLKSGYHHVDIFPQHRQYLGFAWTFPDGRHRFFVFNVLPFGLSSAPYLFTKLLRPLVKNWRCRGLHSVVYLDDGINFEQSYEKADYAAHHMKGDLCAAGFVINEEKSTWEPSHIIEWLGIVWNCELGSISIKEERVSKLNAMLEKINSDCCISARELASVTGSIISMSPVVGHLANIMTRHCQITIAAAQDWDSKHELDNYCLNEITFWRENIKCVNMKKCFSHQVYNKIVYSDASNYACGALTEGDKEVICHKMFSAAESRLSSTHRELIAIQYSLESFGHKLCNSRVKWFTDNQATAGRIVDVGSMKLQLHTLAYRIYSYCIKNNIDLNIQWIPRSLNHRADYVSKMIDCDDWQLSRECFETLELLWGPHTLDCFASFYNTKICRFFSRFWNPGSFGVDAFFQSWEGENCLVVPPVSITCRVLNLISSKKVQCTLVVPAWPSAAYWPVLWQRYSPIIKEYRYFKGSDACIHGRNTNSLIGSKEWSGHVIAIRFTFDSQA